MSDLEYLLTLLSVFAMAVQMMNSQLQQAIGTGLFGVCTILFVHFLYRKMPLVLEVPSIRFGLSVFFIRKLWRKQLSPLSKFKLWADGRIEEGMKLYKSKMSDKSIQEYVGGPVDENEKKEFNKHYYNWTHEVFQGLNYAFGENIKTEFQDGLVDWVAVFGGGRKTLITDMEFLRKKIATTKTLDLSESFRSEPDILREYEDFKFKTNKEYKKVENILDNKIRYAETPGGILYRIQNGRAVQQMNWQLANKEGYDGSRDPKVEKLALEEIQKYL